MTVPGRGHSLCWTGLERSVPTEEMTMQSVCSPGWDMGGREAGRGSGADLPVLLGAEESGFCLVQPLLISKLRFPGTNKPVRQNCEFSRFCHCCSGPGNSKAWLGATSLGQCHGTADYLTMSNATHSHRPNNAHLGEPLPLPSSEQRTGFSRP